MQVFLHQISNSNNKNARYASYIHSHNVRASYAARARKATTATKMHTTHHTFTRIMFTHHTLHERERGRISFLPSENVNKLHQCAPTAPVVGEFIALLAKHASVVLHPSYRTAPRHRLASSPDAPLSASLGSSHPQTLWSTKRGRPIG